MNLLLNALKSTILATLIFWIIIIIHNFQVQMLWLIIISSIPIFICCFLTIVLTICPFFRLFKTESLDEKSIFRTFFPFYSITYFGLCTCGMYMNNFEIYSIAFFTAAFITTSQSWIWFIKDAAS